MIKILNKLCVEGTYVNVTKTIHDRPTVNIIFNGQRFELFLQDQKQERVPPLLL